MNQLVASIAADFSTEFAALYDVEEPADEYFDPIVRVLGRSPTKDDAFSLLKTRIPEFTKELAEWLELDLDSSTVRAIYQQALRNFYGATGTG